MKNLTRRTVLRGGAAVGAVGVAAGVATTAAHALTGNMPQLGGGDATQETLIRWTCPDWHWWPALGGGDILFLDAGPTPMRDRGLYCLREADDFRMVHVSHSVTYRNGIEVRGKRNVVCNSLYLDDFASSFEWAGTDAMRGHRVVLIQPRFLLPDSLAENGHA